MKRLCAIPQKCPIPNLRVAALMNSRLCFEHQIRFILLFQETSLSSGSSRAGSGQRAGRALWQGWEIPACWGQGCLPRCSQTKAGWWLPGDNSTARNPTSDTSCSREVQPRSRQQGMFYSCGAQPAASGMATARTCGRPLSRNLLDSEFSWEFLRTLHCPEIIISTCKWLFYIQASKHSYHSTSSPQLLTKLQTE